MYTIGQISEMFHIPISTLHFYDREGLFPGMERQGNIRLFGDVEVERLHVIECLKASGMKIKDIKQFMEWCEAGPSTFAKRKALFEERRQALEEEMKDLQKTMDMLKFKCWYYENALADGSTDRVRAMMPDHLPPEIQKLYDNGHRLK